MQGKTHLVTGALAGLAVGLVMGESDPLDLAVCTAIGGVAGLVPDWLQVNIPGASSQIRGAFGHRGFSHWVWTPLALAFVLGLPGVPPAALLGPKLAAVAGWLSHIALDALSGGVPAFWPFGRLVIGHVKTGGRIDTFVGGAALVIAVSVALYQFL